MEYAIDLDPTHEVLRVTMTGTVTDPAFREIYASLSRFAATGGPYALILDMSGVTSNQLSIETIRDMAKKLPQSRSEDRMWWSHPGPKTMQWVTCSSY